MSSAAMSAPLPAAYASPVSESPAVEPAIQPVTRPAPAEAASQPAVAAEVPRLIELNDRVVTFTNLQNHVYENVKLVRVDPQRLTYLEEGGGGSILLRDLPLPFLVSIGVPTNWPSVMARLDGSAPSFSAASGNSRGNFTVGDQVEAHWGGRWQPGRQYTDRSPAADYPR